MFSVRIHGRGGQGVVTAAELLSAAAFAEGLEAQAFPSFGSERMGAPVTAFCRIDSRPIRLREPIAEPDAVVIQDATLLHHVDVFGGLRDDGYVVVNSSRTIEELGLQELHGRHDPERVIAVPASEIARAHLGRPIPNVALLGALASLAGVVSLQALEDAIRERFAGEAAAGNLAAAREAAGRVEGRAPAPARRQRGGRGMRQQIEASQAVANAVARCRPEVICAYPITPQTHIVEALSRLVASGRLAPCEFVNVESELAAMSVAIGACATGARAYTATASQGLLYMAEALFNASGLGLPIVMTVGNRAIGAPINIWNDQGDSMAMRDCGWIQLYAADSQEAVDMHVQAFRIAEALSLPVMVCMDGFVLTHAVEPLAVPSQRQVDDFLPAFDPQQLLDPAQPVTIGAMVGPEAFTEVRCLAHTKQMQALDLIPEVAAEFHARFGRSSGGLLDSYRCEDAETIVIALGSVLGTIADAVDELRAEGASIGALAVKTFRPFPLAEMGRALARAARAVVLERALAVGAGGILTDNVRAAQPSLQIHTAIAGLGGRAITRRSLRSLFERALAGELEHLHFLDLRADVVQRELTRAAEGGGRGPHAESILRELGLVMAGPV